MKLLAIKRVAELLASRPHGAKLLQEFIQKQDAKTLQKSTRKAHREAVLLVKDLKDYLGLMDKEEVGRLVGAAELCSWALAEDPIPPEELADMVAAFSRHLLSINQFNKIVEALG